jgi:anti-sigma B factor antagonist
MLEDRVCVLRLSAVRENGTVRLAVGGMLDIATGPQLREYFEQVLGSYTERLIADFSELNFIDAAGLGALIAIRIRAEKQYVSLTLTGVPAHMLRLLRLSRVETCFTLLPAEIC